jgi:hypothetical protein
MSEILQTETVEAPDTTLWRPLGSWLWVRLVDPWRPEGAELWTPEEPNNSDAVVILSGPEARDTERLDRVLFQMHHFRPGAQEKRGFVREADLVARLDRGDENEADPNPWLALNDWVLVRPDPLPREETLASGVVRVARTLPGGNARDLQRGKELYDQVQSWYQSPEYQVMSRPDQRRTTQLRCSAWSAKDQQLVREEMDRVKAGNPTRDGDWRLSLKPTSQKTPNRGAVISVGPQAIRELLYEALLDGWFPGFAELFVNDTVYWDEDFQGLDLWSQDGTRLLALKAEHLCAVETE